MTMSTAEAVSNRSLAYKMSAFVHLGRSMRAGTGLGWKPHDSLKADPKAKPNFTFDQFAIECGLLPVGDTELKKGKRYEFVLDCTIDNKQGWAHIAPTQRLLELAEVSYGPLLPPAGRTGRREITVWIRPVADMDAAELLESAFYLFLLA